MVVQNHAFYASMTGRDTKVVSILLKQPAQAKVRKTIQTPHEQC